MKNKKFIELPDLTIIEVIAKNGNKVYKQEMTYGDAKNIKKKKGFSYSFFQLGFSSYKNVINLNK